VLGFVTTVVGNVIQEQREKRRLSRFFSPAVVSKLIRSHDADDALSSERRVVTVMFSDIRGFTSMSEHMAPEQVQAFLREYLGTMTRAVFDHGGTVDKYVGDAIVALYNAPYDMPDHAVQAVRTALEFQERLGPLRRRFGQVLGSDIRCGVGIHTGEALVGSLGSELRLEYTAIGDTINLGSRLEGLTKRFDVPIIISEATYREVRGQFRTRALGEVGVRGRAEAVQVYAVLGPADGTSDVEGPPASAPATAGADR
jgi:adenylate cyclase